MTTVLTPEYRAIALQSSNDMIRYDARYGDGEYAVAAEHAYKAGVARCRMASLAENACDYPRAAGNYLSAASCFYGATQPRVMLEMLEHVARMEAKGGLPDDRLDLQEDFRELTDQWGELETRRAKFLNEFAGQNISLDRSDSSAYSWLITQIHDLPGEALLHYALFRQAEHLGHADALEHLKWAWTFEPNNPDLTALYGYKLLAAGDAAKAVEVGANHLHTFKDAPPNVRAMYEAAVAADTPERELGVKMLEMQEAADRSVFDFAHPAAA